MDYLSDAFVISFNCVVIRKSKSPLWAVMESEMAPLKVGGVVV